MKLLSCHVENFGRLKNFDYEFSGGLNEILHENGWGKSTFAVFLKAMFYGMTKKGNNKAYAVERSKYMPWQGGVYGGTITFEIAGNTYKVYRTFGSTPERDMFSCIDLSTNKRTDKFTENLGYEIYGVGRETFEITSYFPQLAENGNLTDEVRATLSGVNNLQNDLANFSKAIAKIDEKIKLLKKEVSAYSSAEANLQKIAKIEKQIEDEGENIFALQDEVEVLTEKLDALKIDYENAKKELEVKELFKAEIAELKDKLMTKKSDLLAFQIKLSEFVQENENRGMKNKFILSNNKIRNILYYGSILLSMLLFTLLAFEMIYGAHTLWLCLSAGFLALDVGIIYYCRWSQKRKKIVLNNKIEIDEYQKQVEELHQDVLTLQQIIDAKTNEQPVEEIEVDKNTDKIVAEYSACEKNIAVKKMQISYIQKNIENLEGEKEALTVEQLAWQEKKLKNEEKIKLLNQTRDLLNLAKINLSKRYIAPMQEKFTNYVQQVIAESASKYALDIDMKVSVDDPTGSKEMEYLSQGYQDLMNICRRFSIIESVFQKDKPIIILDDPFVNFDDKISQNAVKLLKKLADSYQIVYLCCNTSRKI